MVHDEHNLVVRLIAEDLSLKIALIHAYDQRDSHILLKHTLGQRDVNMLLVDFLVIEDFSLLSTKNYLSFPL